MAAPLAGRSGLRHHPIPPTGGASSLPTRHTPCNFSQRKPAVFRCIGTRAATHNAGVRAGFLTAIALACLAGPASAQELEPGAYWPLPRGLNILTVVNSINAGDLTFDPALPIEDASATINTTVVAYTRGMALGGRSANISLQLPVVAGSIEGLYRGEQVDVSRFGQADPRFRLGLNLYGAPAMTPRDFAAYHLKTIVGVSVTVAPPLGQYKNTQVVNIGANRWSVKAEMGLSHAMGPWIVELMGGVWVFTDNHEFSGGRTREQDPIASAQVHLTYRPRRSLWFAGNANFYRGGRTTVGGTPSFDLQRNARVGATFSAALTSAHSVRVAVSRGAYTTIGGDFTSLIAGYNYAWVR